MSSCVGYTGPCACWYTYELRQLNVFNIRRSVWKNSVVLNNILQIYSNSSTYNIHKKIVLGYRIESTIPTVLHDLWKKVLLMCRPATLIGMSLAVSLIHKGKIVTALVY